MKRNQNISKYLIISMVLLAVSVGMTLLAMYEKNGQPLEKVIRHIVDACFIRPKQRPYQTNNFYTLLERQDNLDKEVYRIVNGKTQAHAGRKKAD